MKKLIIAAAIVCAATISQAAAVGWSCTAAGWKNCDYSVFVVGLNGVTGTDQIKALVADGGLEAADSYAFASGLTSNNSGAATKNADSSGKSITYSGSGTDTYQMFLVFEDAKGKTPPIRPLRHSSWRTIRPARLSTSPTRTRT